VCSGIHGWGRLKSRRGKDVLTFSENPLSGNKHLSFEISVDIPDRYQFDEPLTHIGLHIKKKRIEQKLFQRQVACFVGVSTDTICNWENGLAEISLKCMPRVISFLGYNPFPMPKEILKKLEWYKTKNGLSFKELGFQMKRDPGQLADWFSGRHSPTGKNIYDIDVFINKVLPEEIV
jgi:DNA-binding XRE family transcriptional regulator